MKRLEYIFFAIAAIALGTGMHFVHHASFFNEFWGYIFPVRESVWEHMKMLLYPLLLESIYLICRHRDWRAIAGPVLIAVPAMAVQVALFFSYFVFVGHEISIIDVLEYIVVLAGAIWVGARWSAKPHVRAMAPLAVALIPALAWALGYLTYTYPDWVLFEAM